MAFDMLRYLEDNPRSTFALCLAAAIVVVDVVSGPEYRMTFLSAM